MNLVILLQCQILWKKNTLTRIRTSGTQATQPPHCPLPDHPTHLNILRGRCSRADLINIAPIDTQYIRCNKNQAWTKDYSQLAVCSPAKLVYTSELGV